MRTDWESPFLDAELPAAGSIAGSQVLVPDLESPFLEALVGVEAEPPLEFDEPQKGKAIPRSKVSDALGSQILDLLWEPIAETDVRRMADRLRRLEAVLDGQSDAMACVLLQRLLPKGDLHPDFRYRLSTPSRQRLRRKLRQRCQPPPPPRRQPDPVPVPKPVPKPITGVAPPDRPTITVQPRQWHVVGEYVFKTRDRRIKRFKRLGIYFHFELEVTGSVNATGNEALTIKARWENGVYKPELETKFDSMLIPDIKVERDGGNLNVKFKKDIPILGKALTCAPHVHLSLREPFSTECTFLPFKLKHTIQGQELQVEVKPKLVVLARVEWKRIIVDKIIDRIKPFLVDLWNDLVGFFGKKILKGLALRLAIASLVGAVVAWLLFTEDDEEIEVEPPDINGWLPALEYASGGKDPGPAAEALLNRAAIHRRAFAKGYGDTLAELTRGEWAKRLVDLESRTVLAFKDLPGPKAAAADWIAWSYWAGKQIQEKVHLPDDDFVRRFRRSEVALMFAAAAYRRGKLSDSEYNNARQTALQQASIAGMAGAVQHAQHTISQNTYEFLNEQGKLERRDGVEAWKGIARIVRKSGIKEADIQRRLGQLGVEQLPVIT